jgi:uncharacterized membrane protein
MEEFLIFVFLICLLFLYLEISNLKKQNKYFREKLNKNEIDNRELKSKFAEFKKTLENSDFSIQQSSRPDEKLKEQETLEVAETVETFTIEPTTVLDEKPIPQEIIEALEVVEEVDNTRLDTFDNIGQSNEIQLDNERVEDVLATEENPVETTMFEKPIFSQERQPLPRKKKVAIEEKVYVETAFSKFIKKAEKQFAENWTGILGTAIMVLGIGYLSIYTALKVSPLFRVLILWFYAGLFVGTYYFLSKKEKWVSTGLWLRSAGASLFLFGCYGASQIPILSFISNAFASYALIGLGIGLNLYIGYIIKKQTFLSLHVILSILILCVIPDKTLATFILAATTATIGILLSYKEKWGYHLLIVISAFMIFDIWFNAQGAKLLATENIFAILGIIAVAGSCMIMQYRKVYENTFFDKTAFITHFINWVLFAIGIILHSTGSNFKTFVLFSGAIICLFMALKARKKKIYWLYHLDGMVAFILLALGTIMLNDWNVGFDVIACILYLIIMICLFIVYKSKETLLHKIFVGINHFAAVVLIVFSAMMLSNLLDSTKITSVLATVIVLSIIAISVPIVSSVKKEFESIDAFYGAKNLSLNGLMAIVFLAFVILKSNDVLIHNLFVVVVFAIAIIWCFLKKKFKNNTFDVGRIIFYIMSIIVSLVVIKIQAKDNFDFVFAVGLLAVISFNWMENYFYKNDFIIRFIGIIGVNALLLLLVCKYLPQHQIIQVFSLFGIALFNHEFLWLNFKKNSLTKGNQTFLYILYYFFIIVGSLLLLYRSKFLSSTEMGFICLGISAINIYVLFAKRFKNNSEETVEEWTNFNLLNSEFLVFNSLLFGFSCLQLEYVSICFGVLAIITFIGFQKFQEFKRFNNYSFFLMLGSIVMMLYIAIENIDKNEKTLAYITQAATLLVSIGYSYLQYKSKEAKDKKFAAILPYIQNLSVLVLFLLQVETAYISILLMLLALLNFWLVTANKIKITIRFVSLIALLAIGLSIWYGFYKLNSFTLSDWVFQLGSVALGVVLSVFLSKVEELELMKTKYQIVLNICLSSIMLSQLPHKWLPVFWAITAILNLYLYHKKISNEKKINVFYYLLANLHLGFLSFNFYESKFLAVYLLIFAALAAYIYLAYKWIGNSKFKNSLLIYPATLSIGCFLYLTFDKGVLTFFWILEALGLLILGIVLKEKYFRYVSLFLVGLCVIRLMFFDLSNAEMLIRALVLLGVGVVLLIMNSLFKKYKDRFD